MEVPAADFHGIRSKVMILSGEQATEAGEFCRDEPLSGKIVQAGQPCKATGSGRLSPIRSLRWLRENNAYCGGTTLKYFAGILRSMGVIQSKPPSGRRFETTGAQVVRSDDASMTNGMPFGPETWSRRKPSPMA